METHIALSSTGRGRFRSVAIAGVIVPLLAVALTACSSVAYEGPYTAGFRSSLADYSSETVTVSADVQEVISPASFVIEGAEKGNVEPMLVVARQDDVVEINKGVSVEVTGVVHRASDLQSVEQELGIVIEESELENRDAGSFFIQAAEIDTVIDTG